MADSTRQAPQLADESIPGLATWRSFLLANSRLLAALDDDLRREHNFSIGDYDVLIQLARVPEGLRMCDLAAAVVLSPSGLTRRVDRLERAGLVRRHRSANDGRNVETRLTPAGRRLFKRLRGTHVAGIQERFLDHFSDEEITVLGELLDRLVPDQRP